MSSEEGREGGEWQKMGRKQVTKKHRDTGLKGKRNISKRARISHSKIIIMMLIIFVFIIACLHGESFGGK